MEIRDTLRDISASRSTEFVRIQLPSRDILFSSEEIGQLAAVVEHSQQPLFDLQEFFEDEQVGVRTARQLAYFFNANMERLLLLMSS